MAGGDNLLASSTSPPLVTDLEEKEETGEVVERRGVWLSTLFFLVHTSRCASFPPSLANSGSGKRRNKVAFDTPSQALRDLDPALYPV